MRVLGLIPARGGSKGILRKNIREIAGKPLIGWTIQAARAVQGIDAVVVSTEDPEIAEVARACGAEVPFMRPIELAADETPGIDPVFHALDMLPEFDAVMLLQPTSPLRTAGDVEGVLAVAAESSTPSVVSVCAADSHPAWMYTLTSGNKLVAASSARAVARRQDLPPVYTLNGAIYFAQAEWLRANRRFVDPHTRGYVMPVERSIDIDGPLDWRIAEMLLGDAA